VFRTRPFPRPLVVTALACAMAAAVTSGPAAARELRDAAPTSSLAGTTSTTPEQDPRAGDDAPSARDDASEAARLEKIALAQERYYSSYGEPEPLPVAEAPAPAPVDEPQPWLPISIAIAAALTIAAASVMVLRRRRVAT